MVPNCSPSHDASIGTQRDLPTSNFQVDLSRSLRTMLFITISGDLNIDLNQKVFTKLVGLSTNYQTPFAFVAIIRGFRDLKGGPKRLLPDSEPFRARPE